MFKKEIDVKSQQRLSGADRKKLKRTIKERFPKLSDADVNALLPPKVELSACRCANRVVVYGVEGECPMFYDADGRSQIFPTVYALWKVPDLLPSFVLKGGLVSKYVLGGADLMFPGIEVPADGLPSFSAGEPWSVKVPGNPAPIAVGTTTMSTTEALEAKLHGKALRISHYYGDALWASAERPFIPNAGFMEGVVLEDPAILPSSDISDSYQDNESVEKENSSGTENTGNDGATDGASTLCDFGDNSATEPIITEVADLHLEESSIDAEHNTDNQHPLTAEEVDILFDKCLLQALHTTVKQKDLPIVGSILWSAHVLPCRPPGVTLDIKKSSYKKLSKWLQVKAANGLISVKEDKHTKEMHLISVNRKHPDYTSFVPEKKKADENEQAVKNVANDEQGDRLMDVMELYKPSSHVIPVFKATGADSAKLYSASQASEIIFEYVDKEKLVKQGDTSTVVLDATLCDVLFKGTIKKGSTYPTEIHKKDLGPGFISRMQAHHLVTRGSESIVRKGELKPIQITTERRQGNKKVTKVSGLESFLIDGETLASELQKKFACSTTVSELPGKKGLEVLIQGGVIDNLGRYLVEHYGVHKKYIEVFDKTKK